MLEVVTRRGRAGGRRRRPCCCYGGRRSLPAGCCGCGVCGADAGALDRAIGNGEEEIREDDENGKGETYWRLQPALLLSGGRRLVAGDGESRRSCGGLVQGGWRLRASVECESASVRGRGREVRLKCFVGWAVSQKKSYYVSSPRIDLFTIFFPRYST